MFGTFALSVIIFHVAVVFARRSHKSAAFCKHETCASIMLVDNTEVNGLQDCIDGRPILINEFEALNTCVKSNSSVYLDKKSMHYVSCLTPDPKNIDQKLHMKFETSTNPENWILENDLDEDHIYSSYKDAKAYILAQYENVDHDAMYFDADNSNTDDEQCLDIYGRSSDLLEDVEMCVFIQIDYDIEKEGYKAHTYVPRRTPDFLEILTSMPDHAGFEINSEMKEYFFLDKEGDRNSSEELCYGRAEMHSRVMICLHKPLPEKAFNQVSNSSYMCVNFGNETAHTLEYDQGKKISNLEGSPMFSGTWDKTPAFMKYIQFSEKCYSEIRVKHTKRESNAVHVQMIVMVYGSEEYSACKGMPFDMDLEEKTKNFVAKSYKEMGKACPKDMQLDTELTFCLSGKSEVFFVNLIHSLEEISTAKVFKQCFFKTNHPDCAFIYEEDQRTVFGVPDWNALVEVAEAVSPAYENSKHPGYTCYLFFFANSSLASKLKKKGCPVYWIWKTHHDLMTCTCTTPYCDHYDNRIAEIHHELEAQYTCYSSTNYHTVEAKPAHYHICGALYLTTDRQYYFASLTDALGHVNIDHALCLLKSDRYAKGYSMCQAVKGVFDGVFCCCQAGRTPCNDEENFKNYITKPKNPFPGCFIEGTLKDSRCKDSKDVKSYKHFMCRSERTGFNESMKVEHGCELHDHGPRNRREVICSGPMVNLLHRSDDPCYTVAIEALNKGPPGYDIVLCCHPSGFRTNGAMLAQQNFTTFATFV